MITTQWTGAHLEVMAAELQHVPDERLLHDFQRDAELVADVSGAFAYLATATMAVLRAREIQRRAQIRFAEGT